MNYQELENNFVTSMEQWRAAHNLTMEEMAKALQISLSKYKRIVSGTTSTIDLEIIWRLYTLTGMFVCEFVKDKTSGIELANKIKKLTVRQRTFIDAVVDFEVAINKEHENSEDYITVFVPTGNMEDGMVYDSSSFEILDVSKYRKMYRERIDCGIKITSNHLHPVYLKDDILLISHTAIRDGDTGIFLNTDTGCVYIRKFLQENPCRLCPVNGYGSPFIVDPESWDSMREWFKYGKVVAKIR